MPKMISLKHQAGPTLVSGGIFYQGFGELQKVTDFQLTHDLDATMNSGLAVLSGYTRHAYGTVVSGNQVRVNVEKTLLSGGVTVADAADVASNMFYVLGYGE